MRKLSDKLDNNATDKGELTAEQWDSVSKELENVVEDVEPLNANDNFQLLKAIKKLIKNVTDPIINTLNTHTHPYLPINGKAVDSDKLDGHDHTYFESNSVFATFKETLYPAVNEDNWADITELDEDDNILFTIDANGVIKIKEAGIYNVYLQITGNGDSDHMGGDQTRIQILAWPYTSTHMAPTKDFWVEGHTETTRYFPADYEFKLRYDSGRLHTWADRKFTRLAITKIGARRW